MEQSAVLIESSTQTVPRDRKSEEDKTQTKDSKTEWSEEEKKRLLDALKKYYFVLFLLFKLYMSRCKSPFIYISL